MTLNKRAGTTSNATFKQSRADWGEWDGARKKKKE